MRDWQDWLEVRDVLDRVAAAIDAQRWDVVRSCFDTDCTADFGQFGSWDSRDAFVGWLEQTAARLGPMLHRMSNHQITVEGDTATAVSYVDAVVRRDDDPTYDAQRTIAIYRDRLRRGPDGWRITARVNETFLRRRELRVPVEDGS